MERSLISDYRQTMTNALPALRHGEDGAQLLLELARLPELIRGFGHVKQAGVKKAREQKQVLLARLEALATVADVRPGQAVSRAMA